MVSSQGNRWRTGGVDGESLIELCVNLGKW